MSRLSGKRALVTGAGSGLGREISLAMAKEGAQLLLADHDESGVQHTRDLVDSLCSGAAADQPSAVAVVADVTDEEQLDDAVARAEDVFGGLDTVVANAGIDGAGSVTETSVDLWHRVMAVNATGVWLTLRAALPAMIRSGGGSAILQASTAGLVGVPDLSAYSAAKGAVIALARQAAVDYGGRGIRINALCPGTVNTPLTERTLRERGMGANTEEVLARAARKYPMGQLGKPSDIAQAVVYLASDDAEWVTGVALPVDGGYVSR